MKEVGRMKTKELNKGEIIITSQDLHNPETAVSTPTLPRNPHVPAYPKEFYP